MKFLGDESDPKLNLHSYVISTKKFRKATRSNAFHYETYFGVAKEDPNQKPAVYKFYDFTKGGTNIVDR